MSLRDLYRLLERPGKNPIKDLHAALDKAVMEAYGFKEQEDILAQLLALNLTVAEKETGRPLQSKPWLIVQPYSEQAENQLKNQITSSTPSVYFIKGKILAGETGYKKDLSQESAYYRIYKDGVTTHLLWIENYKYGQGKQVKPLLFEDLLGTLDFPKE